MKVLRPCLKLIALTAVAASAAACVPEGPTATGGSIGRNLIGGPTYRTAWRDIKPYELVVNIVDLEGVTVQRAQQRTRDNALVHQRATLDEGAISIEYNIGNFFNVETTLYLNDLATAKAEISKYHKKRNQKFKYDEARRIHAYGDRGGWVSLVRNKETGRVCIFARMGFLNDRARASWSADEHYDTIVRFRDCSGERSLDDVESFLKRLKIVPPEYNRSMAGR